MEALGDRLARQIAPDDDQTRGACALWPGAEVGQGVEDVLHAVHYDRGLAPHRIEDALQAQQLVAVHLQQLLDPGDEPAQLHRLGRDDGECMNPVVVAVDVVAVVVGIRA